MYVICKNLQGNVILKTSSNLKMYARPASHFKVHASIEEGRAREQSTIALLPGKPLPMSSSISS
jgi:hypothetical protein